MYYMQSLIPAMNGKYQLRHLVPIIEHSLFCAALLRSSSGDPLLITDS